MLIENERGQYGTGFLVGRINEGETDKGRVFLVTNKHVLADRREEREKAPHVILHVNIKDKTQVIHKQEAEIYLKTGDAKHFREHASPDIDVLALEVTGLLVQYPEIQNQIVTYQMLADSKKREELDIKIGDEIMMIGYPLGLRHYATNFPLVTTGIISTRLGELIEEPQRQPDGSFSKRILRGFWIDGTSISGSSGSPVVLRPLNWRYVKGRIQMQSSSIVLLGVMAETKHALIKTSKGYIPSLSGLGLAFDTETIKETIELFYAR